MSESQDDAYSEACEEIEQLKAWQLEAEKTLFNAARIAAEQFQDIERLKESLHEAGMRNGILVLQLREKDLVIATMNEAHKLLTAEKDAEIERLKEESSAIENQVVEYAGQLLEDAKEIAKLKKLITELADALEESGFYCGEGSLVQRAREAAKDE